MNDIDLLAALQNLPLLVFRLAGDGRMFSVSSAGGGMLAILGAPSGNAAAWLNDAIHPDDRAAFATPDDSRRRVRIRDAGGGWRWFGLSHAAVERLPGSIRYTGLLTDASDLVAAEEAAKRYRDYCELSSDWYWEMDEQHRFTYFSREFEAITGVSRARVIGKTRWESLRENDLGGADWEGHMRAVTALEPFRNFEYPSRRPDGQIIWYRVSGRPRFDGQGRFLGYMGIASDVTAERHIQGRLQHSERLASIGQLAAGVAHEINNPIGFVRSNFETLNGYLQTLLDLVDRYSALESGPLSSAMPAELQAAKAAAELDFLRQDGPVLLSECRDGLDRVCRIVSDLRDFAREGETKWCEMAIEGCLESVLNLTAGQLGEHIRIERRYTPLPAVIGQPGQLNQVFLALLTNAAQAIGSRGGVITVSTGCEDASQVWVEIADTGEGIAAEQLPHIFEPFFTTRPLGQGTGMGLSACYGIVSLHDGRIDVRSTPGEGSTFRVTLPCRPAASRQFGAPAATSVR